LCYQKASWTTAYETVLISNYQIEKTILEKKLLYMVSFYKEF